MTLSFGKARMACSVFPFIRVPCVPCLISFVSGSPSGSFEFRVDGLVLSHVPCLLVSWFVCLVFVSSFRVDISRSFPGHEQAVDRDGGAHLRTDSHDEQVRFPSKSSMSNPIALAFVPGV